MKEDENFSIQEIILEQYFHEEELSGVVPTQA